MNDKYAKEVAKELKLIRRELQKMNAPKMVSDEAEALMYLKENLKDLPEIINKEKIERMNNI